MAGADFFWTTSSTTSTATLALSATVMATNCGDVRTATVTFGIRDTTTGLVTPFGNNTTNVPVGLVNGTGDTTVGTATTTVQYNVGSGNFASFELAVVIGWNKVGNYNHNSPADDQEIGVAVPGVANEMIGVGQLNNTTTPLSNGWLGSAPAPGPGNYTTITSNITYNKSLANPHGNVNILLKSYNRPDGTVDTSVHTYSITSNAISSFTEQTDPNNSNQMTVSFAAKANVIEITNPAAPVSVDGGAQMQVVMTPSAPATTCTNTSGTTGSSCAQQAAVTVQKNKNTGGMWYSSAWNGKQTGLKPLTGGTVVVQ